jgi:hypothetical protein
MRHPVAATRMKDTDFRYFQRKFAAGMDYLTGPKNGRAARVKDDFRGLS